MTSAKQKKEGRLPLPDEKERIVDEQFPGGPIACIKYCTEVSRVPQWREALERYADELNTPGLLQTFFTPGFKHGLQLKITKGKYNGVSIAVYNTGTIILQGRSVVNWDKEQFPHLRDLANKDKDRKGKPKDENRESKKLDEFDHDADITEAKKRRVDDPNNSKNMGQESRDVDAGPNPAEKFVPGSPKKRVQEIECRNITPPRPCGGSTSCLSEAVNIDMSPQRTKAEEIKIADNPLTPVSEKLMNPSPSTQTGATTTESAKTKIPVRFGSPMTDKGMSPMETKAMFEILTRVEQSQVNNTREMEKLSGEVSSMKTTVQDINRRVTKMEGDLDKKGAAHNSEMESQFEENIKPLQETLVTIREDIQLVDDKVNRIELQLKEAKPNMADLGKVVKANTPDLEKMRQMMLQCAPDMEELRKMLHHTFEEMEKSFKVNMKPLQDTLEAMDGRMQGNAATGKSQEEDLHNYYCKGEGDILSNLYPIEVKYRGDTYTSAEHAFHITRAIHILGPDHELIKRMMDEGSPYIIKTELSKEIPYSASWNKKERSVMTEIVQGKVDQHAEVEMALQATGSKRIVHNVADKYWGTGGKRGNGKNLQGRILMSIRDRKDYETEAEDLDQISDEEPEDWSAVEPRYKHKFGNTPSIIFGDSLTGPFRENQFDNRGTYKIQAFTSSQLLKEIKKCEPNPNVKSVTCHVGINDVMTNSDQVKPDHSTHDLKHALIILHEKFPNAIIGYSEAIYKKEEEAVEEFNHEMEIFINTCEWKAKAKYIDHDVDKENFVNRNSDFKHVEESGTKQLVARIKDRLGLRKPGGNHRNEHEDRDQREDNRSRYGQNQHRGGGARGRGRGMTYQDRSQSRNRDGGGHPRGGYGGYQKRGGYSGYQGYKHY